MDVARHYDDDFAGDSERPVGSITQHQSGDAQGLTHLSKTQRGDLAQTAVQLALIKLGYEVLLPVSGACRYDLAVNFGVGFWRVQTKLASINRSRPTPCVEFWIASRYKRGNHYVRHDYTTECDLLAAYCPENDQCYAVPVDGAPLTKIHLLMAQAQHGQVDGIRLADDFLLKDVLAQITEAVA